MSDARYVDQPREVSIETLALCNARCTFCPYPTLDRKGVQMSDEMVMRLLYQLSEFKYPFWFSPFKVNEPLLDPRLQLICETFEKLCSRGRLRLFTNGSPLTTHHVQWIARLKRVEHLWISLNSTDPKEYQTLMGISFEKTAKRLDDLHDGLIPHFPHPVVLSRVSTGDFVRDSEFRMQCFERWPMFRCIVLKRDGWLGYVEPTNGVIPDTPCLRWFELSILSTGVVSLCCMDGEGAHSIGDVNTQSLLEVYNAPHYRDRRLSIVSRRGFEPCRRCTY